MLLKYYASLVNKELREDPVGVVYSVYDTFYAHFLHFSATHTHTHTHAHTHTHTHTNTHTPTLTGTYFYIHMHTQTQHF